MPSKIIITCLSSVTTICLLLCSCPEPPEPEPDYDIFLSVEDFLCTWVTLKVTIPDSGNINRFMIKRDGEEIINTTLLDDDTLITDSFLEPDTDYTYRAYFLKGSTVKDSSDAVTVHTIPTTSHDFIWEIDTLGIYGSYLNDVAIISEDDIWAVGTIITDSIDYNAAHWNGSEWELKSLCPLNNLFIAQGIKVFSEDDIWITSNGTINHWDGKETQRLWSIGDYTKGGVANIWGSSSSDIYFAGRKGTIVHYDGSSFTKMESGTDIDLTDIWGVVDPETCEPHVWACGNASDSRASVILYLKDGQWQKIYERYADDTNNLDSTYMYCPHCETIWADPNSKQLWVGGGFGFFTLDNNQSPTAYSEIRIVDEVGYFAYPYKVRGNSPYDLFITGAFGSFFHYNGKDWHWSSGLYNNACRFRSIDVTHDAVFIVGADHSSFLSKAIVLRGYRN